MISLIETSQFLTEDWKNIGRALFVSGYQKVFIGLKIKLNTSKRVFVRGFLVDGNLRYPLPRTVIGKGREVFIDQQEIKEYFADEITSTFFEIPDDARSFQLQIRVEEAGITPGEVLSIDAIRGYSSNVIGTKAIERIRIGGDVEDADVETIDDTLLDLNSKNALLVASVLYARVNGKIAPVFRDPTFPSLLTISPKEYQINNGNFYSLCEYEGLGVNGVLETIIETPNTDNVSHFEFEAKGTFHTRIQLFEDTTHTSGAEKISNNHDRNSSNVAETKLYQSSGGGIDGNEIDCSEFGFLLAVTGVAMPKYGQGEYKSDKFKLKKNTRYLSRITSLSDENLVNIKLSFHEYLEN